MKLLALHLISFGPFTALDVDLSRGEYGLHVVYGPNEAGKSASLRALTGLFFGIPVRTTDNFLHGNQNLRIGARIRRSDGAEFAFVRRKGSKDTLLDCDGKPIPETALVRFLDGVESGLYLNMFSMDHETLVQGGEHILKGGGVVGESLFAAGLGGTNVRNVLKSLEEETARLFLPKGNRQLITSALKEYREVRQKSIQSSLAAREWTDHDVALRQAMEQKHDVDAEMRRLESERSRLERLQTALPRIAERKELLAKLDAVGHVRTLAASFGKRRHDALQKLHAAREMEKTAVEALARIGKKLEGLVVPRGLVRQEESILGLHEQLGMQRKAQRELPRLQGERLQLETDAKLLLKDLRPGLALQDAETLRLTASKRARIRDLGNSYQALQERLTRSLHDVKKLEVQLAGSREKLKSMDAVRDVSGLRVTVARAQKQGDLEGDLTKAARDARESEKHLEREMKRLGLWNGTLEDLVSLSVPHSTTIDRFDSNFSSIERQLRTLLERIWEARGKVTDLDAGLEELLLSGSIPDEEDLVKARKRRDAGWLLVRKAWIDGEDDPEGARTFFDTEDSLATAFEKSMAEADLIADRLRREADRVAKQATLTAQKQRAIEDLQALERQRSATEERLSRLNDDWRSLWLPLGITPLDPNEMRSWLGGHERLVEQASTLRANQCRIEALKERIEEHRGTLIECLGQLGDSAAGQGETLEVLISRSLALVRETEESERRWRELEESILRLEVDLTEALRERDAARSELSRWQKEWAEAVRDLGLSERATPREVHVVLEKLEELFGKMSKMASIDSRITSIRNEGESFGEEVRRLAEQAAPEFVGGPPDQTVTELNARLHRAREDSAALKALKEQEREKEDLIHKARAAMSEAEFQLGELCREAGCDAYEELEEIEERSMKALALRKEIDALEKRLLDLSGGAGIEELVRNAEKVDADALPGRIAELSAQIRELGEKRSELLETIGKEKNQLQMMDGRGEAAEAAEKAQGILGAIREGVNRYIRLRLSLAVLQREIERYRKENQDPILKRASELFFELTLGSFAGLLTDFNEADEPILLGFRPGGERVSIHGMSEGTRDQLYLSLRLASLERYLSDHEPMPLILDDILINFDDERSEATLRVLDALSRKTQIIFFTHHRHLVDLAEAVVDPGSLHLHSLIR